MADHGCDMLGGKTPLMAAHTPNMDRLAAEGGTGRLVTVPPDLPPGSEVANLSVLGYDVHRVYEGRGVLEAASMGVDLAGDDLALRCNLITLEGACIKNHSAGHISTEEGAELVRMLQQELGSDTVRFYPGVSYRHLLVIKGGSKEIACTPPHDVPGRDFRKVLVTATSAGGNHTATLLNDIIRKSQKLLAEHPVNLKRKEKGEESADSVWPWAQGYKPAMKTFQERFGLSGAVISAVDLIKGIGVYAGMERIEVEGATGLYDTNYEGKADAALTALFDYDFVFLHIEASDEAGHQGDVELKIKTIENLDKRVVGPVMTHLKAGKLPVRVGLLPDHPTPCALRTHVRDPVPFVIHDPAKEADSVMLYDEESVKSGCYGTLSGAGFIHSLLKRRQADKKGA